MIKQLRLQTFRCFGALALDIPEEGALIVGDNAQGKTSILEAICALVRLGSPRVKRMRPMVQSGALGFGIAGDCWGDAVKITYGKGGLTTFRNEEELEKQTHYLSSGGLIVWMGNDDLELVRGASEVRRRYLDFLACQIDEEYRTSLTKYRKALRVRNLLLKDMNPREAEIRAYDEVMIPHGEYISHYRERLIGELRPRIQDAQTHIGSGNEEVRAEYKCAGGLNMAEAIQAAHEKERKLRQTVVGPHRDDIKFYLNGMSAGDYASEGQQRTLALALKLAQGECLREIGGVKPIYLLDDIFGELDKHRRNALVEYLPTDTQKIITTTNVDWLDEKWAGWKRITVSRGVLTV